MVNSAFLDARHIAGTAIQRCLRTIVIHSLTVAHVMYYRANVAAPAGRERHHMDACCIITQYGSTVYVGIVGGPAL